MSILVVQNLVLVMLDRPSLSPSAAHRYSQKRSPSFLHKEETHNPLPCLLEEGLRNAIDTWWSKLYIIYMTHENIKRIFMVSIWTVQKKRLSNTEIRWHQDIHYIDKFKSIFRLTGRCPRIQILLYFTLHMCYYYLDYK